MVVVNGGNLDLFDEGCNNWFLWSGDFVDVSLFVVEKFFFMFDSNKKLKSFLCELELGVMLFVSDFCEMWSYCLYFYLYLLYFKGVCIIKIKMSVSEEFNDFIVD